MKVNQRQVRLIILEAQSQEVKLKFIDEFEHYSRTAKSLKEYLEYIRASRIEVDFPHSSFAILKQLVLQNEEKLFCQ